MSHNNIAKIKIEDIKVYNSKNDEITYKVFSNLSDNVRHTSINLCNKIAELVGDGITSVTLNSSVAEGVSLKQFLYSENGGYFNREENKEVTAVVFADGKFHSSYSRPGRPSTLDIEEIGKKTKSVPTYFFRSVIVD